MQGSKCHYLHLYIETARVSEEPKKEPIKFKPPMCLPQTQIVPMELSGLERNPPTL